MYVKKMSEIIRVRNLYNHMDSLTKARLKKLLPPNTRKPPQTEPIRYPNAILTAFPKEECYALLGYLVEDLLHYPSDQINTDLVVKVAAERHKDINENKIRISKTTQPFIDHMIATKKKIEAVQKGSLRYEEPVQYGTVQGHPDLRTDTQIFEVKMTGQLEENWPHFVYQLFAYAALAPEATDMYLVFPMQELLWHYDVTTWTDRTAFRDLLEEISQKRQKDEANDLVQGSDIRERYCIGCHMPKLKSLPETVLSLPDYKKPYQIFLGSNMSSKLIIKDDELIATKKVVQETGAQIYVHSQYIINLCSDTDDDYHTALLIKNLEYASQMGFKGVVVHVGKSTTRPLETALTNMRTNLLRALEHATHECPILLETPASQGTETLTKYEDFVEFVLKIQDPRLRICVDTCHVFASGYQPVDYLKRLTTYNKKLLKLVHYNDSATPCGSCKDRHAFMGTGHIGIEQMSQIAELCHSFTVPMVIE